jgi:hypothetical protein
VKHTFDVRVQRAVPAGGRELLERRMPVRSGVVNEDVQLLEAVARGLRPRRRALRARKICRRQLHLAKLGESQRRRSKLLLMA